MTTENVGKAPRFTSTFFATTAIACFAYFALALLLMHVLRPDCALATTWISGYAVGRHGWVMTAAWLAASGGCLMLMLGLARSGPRSRAARAGTLLMGVLSLAMLTSAIFLPGKKDEPSTSGEIHSINVLVKVVCILLSSVLLSVGFRSDSRWRAFHRTAATLATLVVLAFLLQSLAVYVGMLYGLANRFFASTLIVWLLAISIQLREVARE
jgi:hypothetical protein